MRFAIRAEGGPGPGDIEPGPFDFNVAANSLAAARITAERIIDEEWGTPEGKVRNAFQWRGQVVFVNTTPAEEQIRPARRLPVPLSTLFQPQSLNLRARTEGVAV